MRKQILKIASLTIAVVLMFLGLMSYSLANTVQVGSEAELRAAINNGDSNINLTSDITITSSIQITSGNKTISINGGGNKLIAGNDLRNMFIISGGDKNITFDNITLDGNSKSRLMDIDGSTVSINNSVVKNGTTEYLEKDINNGINKQRYQGGAIYADGATINLDSTSFVDNYTKTNVPAQELDANGRSQEPSISGHGGAIYLGSRSTLNVLGGSFNNNYSSGGGNTFGEGGAIMVEGASHINMNKTGSKRTTFDGNHNYRTDSNKPGLQGGSIQVTDSTIDIERADFVVKGGFDTGGAIKFQGAGDSNNHNKVKDSTFKLVGGQLPQTPVQSTYFGTSGGAIVSENSFLTIDNSDFTMEGNPGVTFAGGHIDVVGGGEFNLLNSRLTGNAPDWFTWNEVWKYKSAKYGGAIAFENKSSAKALIKDSVIKNYMVDHTGGTIAVGHRNGSEYGNTTVDLSIEGTTIQNGQAFTFDNNSAGAGVYIAPGGKVVIKESEKGVSTITGMLANYGAAIYNKGELTLDGGTKITNNRAEQMAGGLFNDGYANINNAVFSGNIKHNKWNNGEIHGIGVGNPARYEKSGENIYAKKDIIVGSNSTFDGKDIRVIDGQSAVVLSGPRNSLINVSISEEEKESTHFWERDFSENAHRFLGYQVGRGIVSSDKTAVYNPVGMAGSYVPTADDAKKFHYVTRNSYVEDKYIAGVDDHTSTGKWDYVFNPEKNTVVLGQRAKMVYHTNESTGTIDGGEVDTDPNGQKLDQLYTVYGVNGNSLLVSIKNVKATDLTEIDKKPALEGYTFKGWGTETDKEKPKYDVDKSYHPYEFVENNFAKNWLKGSEVTDILYKSPDENKPELANTLNTYAVYDKMLIVKVKKEWDAVNKNETTIQLVRTDKNNEVLEEKTVSADNSDWVTFAGVSKVEDGVDITSKYAIIEKNEADGQITINQNNYKVEYNDLTEKMKAENKAEVDTRYFIVKNKEVFNISVKKYWNDEKENTPVDDGAGDLQDGDDEDGTPGLKFDDKAANIEGESSSINTQNTPEIPESVQVALYRNNHQVGETVTLEKSKNFSGTFNDVPMTDESGRDISEEYEVKEIGEKNGEITISGDNYKVSIIKKSSTEFTIRNTYTPPKEIDIEVNKVWNRGQSSGIPGGDESLAIEYKAAETVTATSATVISTLGTPESIDVKLVRIKTNSENNPETIQTITLEKSKGYMGVFQKVPSVDETGKDITNEYYVVEVGEKDGFIIIDGNKYEVTVSGNPAEGFTIRNSYVPPKRTSIKVVKSWANENQKEESVSVELFKNGQATGAKATLNNDVNWEHSFTDLLVFDDVNEENRNTYTVKEIASDNSYVDNGGVITLNNNKYKVAISGVVDGVITVTNDFMPPKIPLTPAKTKLVVNKAWGDQNNKADNVTVELFKNGTATGNRAVLSEENNWQHTFNNLLVTDDINAEKNVYSVKEVDGSGNYFTTNGVITIDGKQYKVAITDVVNAVVTITNDYMPPSMPLTPAKTKVKVTKSWSDSENKASQTSVVLVKNGVETDKILELSEANQWTATFENLDVVDNIADEEKVVYTVKEVGEYNGKIDLEGNNYTVVITGNAVDGFNIENRYNPPQIPLIPASMKIAVEKKWSDLSHKVAEIEVELLKNGVPTGNVLVLNEANSYKSEFINLPVVDNIKDVNPINYTIKEVGETDGMIKFGEDSYMVKIDGTAKDGFVITNTYIEPKVPEKPKNPEKPNNPESKKDKPNKPSKIPNTGDNFNLPLVGVILLVSVLLVILLLKKKNK